MTEARKSRERRAEETFSYKGFTAGVVLVIIFSIAGCFSVFLRYEVFGTGYLPRGAVFLWLLFLAANAVLYRLSRRRALSRKAVLLALVMLLAIGGLVGQEFTQHFYLYILGIVYYAEPPVASPDLYLNEIPPQLVPSLDRNDPTVAYAYEGLPTGKSVPYRPWIGPLALWTPFVLAYYFMLTSFAGLLARRWEEEERLVYPLMQVPLELVEVQHSSAGPMWKNKLLWAFFAVPCVIYSIKGLHGYFPTVPDMVLQRRSQPIFAGPWVAFNSVSLDIYMDVIGVAYLLTREAAFSMWFFYVFRLFEDFLANVFGQEPGERFCAWGFLGGLAFVVFWCTQMGMAARWALLMIGLFPLVSMVVSRVVTEAGMFIYSSPFRLYETIFDMAGTRRIGVKNVVLMTMVGWTQLRGTATQYMPAAFHNYKVGSDAKISRRQIIFAAMTAIFIALMLSHVFAPWVLYHWGIPKLASWPRNSGLNTARGLARFLTSPMPLSTSDWIGVGLGAATTVFLVMMRKHFLWWPFHPLGFVAWIGWPTERYWLSIMIGWLVKVIVLRLFGFTMFRKLRPAAFGLILGVCFIITVWIIIHFFYPAPALQLE